MRNKTESTTAKICSFARAYHSNYGRQKIFDDYLAYDFMGREEYEEIGQLIEHGYDPALFDPAYAFSSARIREIINGYFAPIPLSRAAFAEQELARFVERHGKCQYVICGAGMDTFAFRNDNADIRIYEIDHPDTQRYKLERIRYLDWRIKPNIRYVAVDFSKDDMVTELLKSGFEPNVPSFFSILGVTYYLTLEEFEKTVGKIGAVSAEGSLLVFDYPDETTLSEDAPERVRQLAAITDLLGETMRHGYASPEVKEALKRCGYKAEQHLTPEDIQRIFFEGRKDAQRAYENIHFLLAEKQGDDIGHFLTGAGL